MTSAEHLLPPEQQPEPAPEEAVHSTRVPLIAFVRDRETLAILSDVLAPALGSSAEFRLGDIAETRAGLRRLSTPVAAILVDVSDQPDPIGVLEDLALYVEPGVRVFVIGDNEDMEFYRQLVRGLGVQEYLYKPISREIVARRILSALTGGTPPPARGGRVVTVTGVHGGVGATTIAVNLAVQLADRSRHHILLFDADLHGGSAALMLSAASGGGLRAALENPGRVDVLFAERSSPAISSRLHLLSTEEPLNALIAVSEGAAGHLTSLLCNRFNFVVVDLPRHGTPLNHELRELAHVRVLVMDPTLPSLRDTLRHLALPRGPRQASRPIIVLNHLGAPGTLTRKQVVEGLGIDVDVVVPWLPKQMHAATTLGQAAVRRRGPFQTAISGLANEILPQRGEPVKSWARRLVSKG
jgi:pilus assembly protein CpaE